MKNDIETSQIIIKIQRDIIDISPASIEGMPYAKAWVFEEVINRLKEDDPLICSSIQGYEEVSPWGAEAAVRGIYKPYLVLERIALKVVKKYLHEVNNVCPSNEERKRLTDQMSKLV